MPDKIFKLNDRVKLVSGAYDGIVIRISHNNTVDVRLSNGSVNIYNTNLLLKLPDEDIKQGDRVQVIDSLLDGRVTRVYGNGSVNIVFDDNTNGVYRKNKLMKLSVIVIIF